MDTADITSRVFSTALLSSARLKHSMGDVEPTALKYGAINKRRTSGYYDGHHFASFKDRDNQKNRTSHNSMISKRNMRIFESIEGRKPQI